MGTTSLFDRFQMRPVGSSDLDAALIDAGDALVAVYLWGENCYNCEQFKRAAMLEADVIAGLELHWLHADVYAWNPTTKPARPEGGECQGARALYALLCERYG